MMKKAGGNQLGGEDWEWPCTQLEEPRGKPGAGVMEAVYCRRSSLEERPGPEEKNLKASMCGGLLETKGLDEIIRAVRVGKKGKRSKDWFWGTSKGDRGRETHVVRWKRGTRRELCPESQVLTVFEGEIRGE